MRFNIPRLLLSLFAAATISTGAAAADYDVVIRGGRVIDPASGRDEIADVGIQGHSIVAISKSPLHGKRVLDAKGLIVSPGFIDLHAHGQEPKAQMLQMQDGVTSALDMEAGALPVNELYKALSGRAVINFGATVAWECARMKVLADMSCHGMQSVPATNPPSDEPNAQQKAALAAATTPEQEQRIVAMMNDEIRRGALGYGLLEGYVYDVGRREIFEIFKAAGTNHYPVFVHVRSPVAEDPAPGGNIASIQELIADAAVTGAPLQVVHVQSTGDVDTPVILEMIAAARRRGLDITTEAYPYDAGEGDIKSVAEAIRQGEDPDSMTPRGGEKVDYSRILWTATGERMTEASFNRLAAENPRGNVIVFSRAPQVVDQAILDPIVSIASDGAPWTTNGEHPRGAGTFSRVLGYYVRDKGLDLKLALAKMTIMPARRLEAVSEQMARKGRLQVGADADITVFDAQKIKDIATYEKPMQPSAGLRYVLVNGVPTLIDGKVVPGVFPGEAIRGTKPL